MKRAKVTKVEKTKKPKLLQKVLELNGETKTVEQWINLNGLSTANLYTRLGLGWTLADAVTRPLANAWDRAASRIRNTGKPSKTDLYCNDYSQGLSVSEIAKKYEVANATVYVSLRRRKVIS